MSFQREKNPTSLFVQCRYLAHLAHWQTYILTIANAQLYITSHCDKNVSKRVNVGLGGCGVVRCIWGSK